MSARSKPKAVKVEPKPRPRRASVKMPPICRVISVEREVAGLSQRDLALRLGVAQSLVGRWSTNSEPRLETIGEIEKVLGLERGELLRAAGYVSDVISVPRAIEEDSVLEDRAKNVLLATYRALRAKYAMVNGKRSASG